MSDIYDLAYKNINELGDLAESGKHTLNSGGGVQRVFLYMVLHR